MMNALWWSLGAVAVAGIGIAILVQLAKKAARAGAFREMAEDDAKRTSAAYESLSKPVPRGNLLLARWRRRMRESASEDDPPVPGA